MPGSPPTAPLKRAIEGTAYGRPKELRHSALTSLPSHHLLPQLQFFPVLHAWMKKQTAAPAGFTAGQLDLGRLAAAGHSRGGKLAALHFASAL